MPITTNHIQNQSLHPHAWFHSPCVHHRSPWSFTCHHYATSMSLHVISHLASPQPNPWHYRHHPNEYNCTWAVLLTIMLSQTHVHLTCLESLLSSSSIVTLLYLVPSLICTPLFSSWHCHFPIPTLHLGHYLWCLVVWSPDLCFSWLPSSSSIAHSYCTWLTCQPGCIALHPSHCI